MFSQLQRFDRVIRPRGYIYYGWYMVAAGAGIQMLSGLLWMQSFGAYVVLLQHDFGWSKALVAGAFAVSRIEGGVIGPLQGWLVDRYGPRAILRIGIVVLALGFLLFSRIHSTLGFYLTVAVIAIGTSLGGFATVMVAIVGWFNRHRAKAVALSQIGGALGGISVPLVILCLEHFGWRTTAELSAGVIAVLGLPAVQLIKHRPSELGETVDGAPPEDEEIQCRTLPGRNRDFTAREALRTRAFWMIGFGHGAALMTVASMTVHLVPHLTEDLQYSLANAGLVVALMTTFQMIGQIGGGYLGDKFDKRTLCIGCMMAHAMGVLLVAYALNVWMVVAFAVLHGLAWGIRGPLMVALRADYFGATSFGTIMGFSSLIIMFGMSAGPVLTGYLADLYGNYEIAFMVLAVAAVLGSFCFLAATPPPLPRRPGD